MKNVVLILIMFCSLLLLTPFLWNRAFPHGAISAATEYSVPENFRLALTENGEIIEIVEISRVDYLIGCLYAQIPPGYSLETLNAQAVAAHTYALRIALNNKNSPQYTLNGKSADISDNSVTCQPFFTQEKAREYYGEEYNLYYDKIRQAAEYGAARVILYGAEPIYSVYHSVSAGATNTARYIWDVDFPYLKSVPSDWDREFIHFISTNEFTTNEVRKLLLSYDPNIIMPLDYALWFSEYAADPSGYVMAVSARNQTLSGGDLWRLLNLRSAAFVIEYTGSVFTATTKGHGHGVGLSQFGADYMAQRGYTAEEILNYYYTDVVIVPC
ncbi:MAG: SpoIID/LytB domain-containing protein [Oscillospiraceae bacterium]|nr:SpoIID/LytB domain-containing protein [Oscillospiraceae bacterium]